MNTIKNNKTSDYSSEAWMEREKHENIMETLGKMYGYASGSGCDYGHCERWAIGNEPSLDFLREVMERGKNDEILFMINQYGRSMPAPNTRVHGCTGCGYGEFHTPVYMPVEIQVLIAERGVRNELQTFTSYYGFSGPGQDVILDRGNHEEIMWYLGLHGLLEDQQKKLFARGNQDEINLHLTKHGLSSGLLSELFDKMENGEGLDVFYKCIEGPDFPVFLQKRMLEVVKTDEFEAYVSKHGLWEDVHVDLVEKRSVSEVRFYLEHHNYLGAGAACKYMKVAGHNNRMYFLQNAYYGVTHTIDTLMRLEPLDNEALCYAFFNYDYARFDWTKQEELDLIKNGTRSEILDYVKELPYLRRKSWASLFFRDVSLFQECIKIVDKR